MELNKNNLMIIGAGVLSFIAVNYLLNKRDENEPKSNATGGCRCANDSTPRYCATRCSVCCGNLGGVVKERQ